MKNIGNIFKDPSDYQRQLEIILKNIADGITVQDPQGKLIFANKVALKILNIPDLETLLKTPPPDLLTNFEILDENGEMFNINNLPGRQALHGKIEPSVILNYRYKKTGEEKWAEVKSTPVFDKNKKVKMVVNVFRDITQNRKSTESLQKLGRIVESSDDAIYSINLETSITSWNNGAANLYGFKKEEIIGKNISHLMPEETLKETLALLNKIKKGEQVNKSESVRRKKDGTVFPVSLTISPIFDVKKSSLVFLLSAVISQKENFSRPDAKNLSVSQAMN